MANVQIIHEVPEKRIKDWQLCFQDCVFYYDDGTQAIALYGVAPMGVSYRHEDKHVFRPKKIWRIYWHKQSWLVGLSRITQNIYKYEEKECMEEPSAALVDCNCAIM